MTCLLALQIIPATEGEFADPLARLEVVMLQTVLPIIVLPTPPYLMPMVTDAKDVPA